MENSNESPVTSEPISAPAPVATNPQPAREIKITVPQVDWSKVAKLMPKNVTAQSKLTILGIALPAFLIWFASYLAFSVAPVTGALSGKNLDGMALFQKIFIGLGFGGGILYMILGGAALVGAFFVYRWAFKTYGMRDLQFGQLRLEAAIHGVLAFVSMIFVATLVLTVLQINPEALSLIGSFASFFN